MQAAQIIAFKDLLRAKFPQAHAVKPPAAVMPTGLACLDAVGLTAGSICEIVSASASSGSGLLLMSLIRGPKDSLHQPVALVDAADAFDPAWVTPETLEQLLWLRCRKVERAIQATDLLLRDGNIPRVLLDLQLCPAREVREVPAQAWHRLRLLAEKSGTALCTFTAFQTVPCARSRLVMEQSYDLESMETKRETLLAALKGRVVRSAAMPATVAMAAAG